MSNIIENIAEKVEKIIHPHTADTTKHTTAAGTYGGSNVIGHNLNAAHNVGNTVAGALDPTSPATGPAPNTAGPSPYDIVNKLNPTVDSDLDNSRNMGMANPAKTTTAGTYGTHSGNNGGSAVAPIAGTGAGAYGSSAVPYSSGAGASATPSQQYPTSVSTGPASYGATTNQAANTFDPTSRATGPADRTAGPSSSNILN